MALRWALVAAALRLAPEPQDANATRQHGALVPPAVVRAAEQESLGPPGDLLVLVARGCSASTWVPAKGRVREEGRSESGDAGPPPLSATRAAVRGR